MKLHKIMFMNFMIMGTLMSISSYSWMSMWMGLEMNLLSIIPLFSSEKNMFSAESSMKYFITQAMASMMLLMAVLLMLNMEMFINPQMNTTYLMLMNSALMIKMGAAPFHFWFPEVMEGLNWFNSFILLTWQKIAPMMILMSNIIIPSFMVMIIIFSLLVSTINSFSQTSLRKIMTFSSINHIAWMLSSMMVSFPIWTLYFLIYSMINLMIIFMLNLQNSFFMNQLNLNKNKKFLKTTMLNFMSLGGLPPFIGFLPKWVVIKSLSLNSMFMLTFILIVSTLIMLFIYIRMMMMTLSISSQMQKMPMSNMNFPMLTTMSTMNMMNLLSLPLFMMTMSAI